MLGVPLVEGDLPEAQVTVGPATRNGRSRGPSVLRGRSPSNGPGYGNDVKPIATGTGHLSAIVPLKRFEAVAMNPEAIP